MSAPECDHEKHARGDQAPVYDANDKDVAVSHSPDGESPEHGTIEVQENALARNLHGRHMQMIAIGGAIGAGLFVGSGGALSTGGPGSLVIENPLTDSLPCFIIVGFMMLLTVQALAEMAVLYPVNGAFFTYACRFVDPAWGFACGWDYAIGWLIILPFEITAAGLTIDFWRTDLNIGIWVAVFLTPLALVQIFGVRGYGEVEFVLSIIKVIACTGFIIFGIIVDCGGVPTDNRGYIGARYWHDPGAFRNGFKGFCSVFVNAAFAFGGTELTGLAAAEAADPRKSIPRATRQVFWRIAFFYVVGTFILGLIVPSDSDVLLGSSGANTKASPFVLAIELAGVKGLPSVFNVVITLAVLSVANSATFASTRTLQALATKKMAPKLFSYIDKKGRPFPVIILQIAFGFLAFVNEAEQGKQIFSWLLALSGLSNFFIWGTICLSHMRFRAGWKAQGRTLDMLPYKATFGVWGSAVGLTLNILCLISQFYVAVWPVGGGTTTAQDFFEVWLAAPIILALYIFWKVFAALSKDGAINTRGWKPFVRVEEMDLDTGLREALIQESPEERKMSVAEQAKSLPKRILTAFV
ncbi:putative general amino-acid permease GAP1 [Aulographum hederae CBS 113979]|uniref:Putative general amino-acid permease GAP1 n=1 Tax=Aulographum hederae CBS 113979 TaxID=1176131 RepID=A0A6G1HHU1_9PEZI|nr:putative general amino-acid permease GAP1 [Aulographum hederae CBS 113979]